MLIPTQKSCWNCVRIALGWRRLGNLRPGPPSPGMSPAFSLEVMPMGIVIFLIGMIVGCVVGGFLLALVAASRINNDEIPDDTDREGWE